MPNTFMALDQGLPRFNGEESIETKVRMLQDYQYQLVEQLRYALQNLDTRNMNMDAMGEWGGTLTEPLYASLMDEDGNMLSLAATAKGIAAQISSMSGKVTALEVAAGEMSAALWDAETGAITQLQATAASLKGALSDKNGNLLSLSATAEGLAALSRDLETGLAKMVTFDSKDGLVVLNEDGEAVQIDGEKVVAGKLIGEEVILNSGTKEIGTLFMRPADTAAYAMELSSNYALSMTAWLGNVYMESWEQTEEGPFFFLGYATNKYEEEVPIIQTGRGALVLSKDETDKRGNVTRRGSYGYDMPSDGEGVQGQVYILLE